MKDKAQKKGFKNFYLEKKEMRILRTNVMCEVNDMDDINDFEIRYTTKDIADKLGVEAVTVRKYALALEKAGYSIDRSNGKDRSYNATDVMAFQYMQSIRSQTSITVEEAATLVAHKNNTATTNETSIVYSEDETLPDRYEMIFSMMRQLLEAQQAADTLPSREALRAERLNEKFVERKIERQLEREAHEAWASKPESERRRRTGLFWKEEDVTARDRFIRDYVDEHYEKRMRQEFGIE